MPSTEESQGFGPDEKTRSVLEKWMDGLYSRREGSGVRVPDPGG